MIFSVKSHMVLVKPKYFVQLVISLTSNKTPFTTIDSTYNIKYNTIARTFISGNHYK